MFAVHGIAHYAPKVANPVLLMEPNFSYYALIAVVPHGQYVKVRFAVLRVSGANPLLKSYTAKVRRILVISLQDKNFFQIELIHFIN